MHVAVWEKLPPCGLADRGGSGCDRPGLGVDMGGFPFLAQQPSSPSSALRAISIPRRSNILKYCPRRPIASPNHDQVSSFRVKIRRAAATCRAKVRPDLPCTNKKKPTAVRACGRSKGRAGPPVDRGAGAAPASPSPSTGIRQQGYCARPVRRQIPGRAGRIDNDLCPFSSQKWAAMNLIGRQDARPVQPLRVNGFSPFCLFLSATYFRRPQGSPTYAKARAVADALAELQPRGPRTCFIPVSRSNVAQPSRCHVVLRQPGPRPTPLRANAPSRDQLRLSENGIDTVFLTPKHAVCNQSKGLGGGLILGPPPMTYIAHQ